MDLIILESNMKNRIIKYANYGLLGFIILTSMYILAQFLPEDSNKFIRRLKTIMGYFVFMPIFFISLYFSIVVLLDYISVKFKQPIKHFLFVLPFLVYFTIYIGMFIYAVFIKKY